MGWQSELKENITSIEQLKKHIKMTPREAQQLAQFVHFALSEGHHGGARECARHWSGEPEANAQQGQGRRPNRDRWHPTSP